MFAQILLAIPLFALPVSRLVPNQYIVVFKDHTDAAQHHIDLLAFNADRWGWGLFSDAFEMLKHHDLPGLRGYTGKSVSGTESIYICINRTNQ